MNVFALSKVSQIRLFVNRSYYYPYEDLGSRNKENLIEMTMTGFTYEYR